MGRRCCVPGCTTNYNRLANGSQIVGSCFRFPKDPNLRQIWINRIGRTDDFKTENVGVCDLHFEPKYIKRHYGEKPKNPQLIGNAVPSIFSYSVYEEESEEINVDLICNFENLKNNIKAMATDSWNINISDSFVTLYKFQRNENASLSVLFSINVSSALDVKVFYMDKVVKSDFYKEIVPKTLKIQLFSQLQKLKEKCETFEFQNSLEFLLNVALDDLSAVIKLIESGIEYKYENIVYVIHDQITQMLRKRKKYSTSTLVCAFIIYLQSSKCYELIRNKNILILPHIKTLLKLSNYQNVDPSSESSSMNYLSKVFSNVGGVGKYVVLEIDEIYCSPQVTFKAKKLTGFAENKDDVATTVIGFFVNSPFGKIKEIANLIPTSSPTAENQTEYVEKLVNALQRLGLIILGIITDNNRMNQKMFKLIPIDNSYSYVNPMYSDRLIRLLYDTTHIGKNFRNNWINKKNTGKSFYYPDFDNFGYIRQASFEHLRALYDSEVNFLIKKAPKLNKKTLYPNAFERQRVPLFLNIIHPTTISALCSAGYEETAQFLNIIRKWFNIMNNRSMINGIHERDESLMLITSPTSPQIDFLKKFVKWLKAWRDLENEKEKDVNEEVDPEELLLEKLNGGLTKDTFQAAIITTEGIVKLIEECFATINIEYFLPGKFQTNDVEKRFGRYRELSGCTYNVSYQDILESEKKMRIKRLISTVPHEFYYAKYSCPTNKEIDIDDFVPVINSDFVKKFQHNDHSSFMYVCGYGAHSISRSLTCQTCRDLIIKSKGNLSTGCEYFDYIQRGGLIEATEHCQFILFTMYALLDGIMEDKICKRKFQISKNQHHILVYGTEKSYLESDSFVVDFQDSCLCGKKYCDLFHPLMIVFANILLNNLTKQINDSVVSKKKEKAFEKCKKKRDLKAFEEFHKKLVDKPNTQKENIVSNSNIQQQNNVYESVSNPKIRKKF